LEQEILFENNSQTILEYIKRELELEEGKARGVLAKFLFSRDDVFKKINSLSGGEKVRLKFCQLMHQDLNLLLFDEPTNHLDIEAKEVMEEALADFKGTLLFISHDRYFINKMAERILYLEKGSLLNYDGNFDYFKEKRNELSLKKTAFVLHQEKPKEKKKIRTSNKQKTRRKTLERKIEECETSISGLTKKMEENPSDYQKNSELYQEKQELSVQLDLLMEEWMELEE